MELGLTGIEGLRRKWQCRMLEYLTVRFITEGKVPVLQPMVRMTCGAFQRMIYEKRLITHGSTMLESAIGSSVIRYDGAGNPALNKAANNARIDALSAAVIAAGLNEIVTPPKPNGSSHCLCITQKSNVGHGCVSRCLKETNTNVLFAGNTKVDWNAIIIIPVAKGGSGNMDNLRAVCRDCHFELDIAGE